MIFNIKMLIPLNSLKYVKFWRFIYELFD